MDSTNIGYTSDISFITTSGPSGFITANPLACKISVGNSTCQTQLSWLTWNLTAADTAVTTLGKPDVSAATSGVNVLATVEYNPTGRIFYLYHNQMELGQVNVTATCALGNWDGSVCTNNPFGTFTLTPCDISEGGSSCLANLSWVTFNLA